ncbi:MAG: hypothetical protein BWY80_01350 [Firmicutes bacterium ADurb.Bin456]|nr:MAG: hypothetical protein BWY80_01350 [Firmicutes bacterium ADurb.Bin456]
MDKVAILKKLDERKKMFDDYLGKIGKPARSSKDRKPLAVSSKNRESWER